MHPSTRLSGSHNRRRGVALIFIIVAMIAIVAFVSLAVDMGRAQCSKGELQTAADAAARAACGSLAAGTISAQNAAVAAAAANKCDGSSVVLTPATDLNFGVWDQTAQTFTVMHGANTSDANAVQIMLTRNTPLVFAQALGATSTTLHGNSTACVIGNTGAYSIIGIASIAMSSNGFTDSYDSSNGAYGGGNLGNKGSIASNGDISLTNFARVNGDARCGVGKTTSAGGSTVITGLKARLAKPLAFPSVTLPGGVYDLGDVTQSSGTIPIPGGTYLIHNLTMSGTAHVTWTGPVVLYIQDSYNISGSVIIDTYQNIPANRKLYFLPTCTSATWTGSHSCVGELYAPDTNFTVGGSAALFGRITARTLNISTSGGLHYDESLPPIGTDATVESIQRVK